MVASGTLLSRLTGFGRVLALVWAFHVTRLGDVYNIANTVPNILYDLLLGGVLSATLDPGLRGLVRPGRRGRGVAGRSRPSARRSRHRWWS